MTLIKPANNKQENTPLAVYAGDLDAGFVRESALQSVQAYIPSSRLKVLEETAWIPNGRCMYRTRCPLSTLKAYTARSFG